MLYEIKGRYHIKVGGFYKEVELSVKNDELVVQPNGRKIEVSAVEDVKKIDMLANREELIESLSKPKEEKKSYKDFRK